MSPNNPAFVVIQIFHLLAGLTLFLHGMGTMSQGLQQAAGAGLRRNLQLATAQSLRAFPLGALLGGMIHSSAGSVMLIGFISAGLVSFSQSIPVILGINVGTTLSMLLISFQLGDACWLAICVGLLMQLFSKTKAAGIGLFGFGLIFLGLSMMSGAIHPFRETLSPVLQYSDGTTVQGMLIGVIASMAFTAIIQSSGATIGMVFAMLTAGAMHSFEQAYPVIIGASIGTCVTALIGAARSTVEAKRCAVTHLLFNLFTALFAMLTAPIMYKFIPLSTPAGVTGAVTADMLVSQCAYANVIRMVLAACIILPLHNRIADFVKIMLPDRGQSGAVSHLDADVLDQPEDACLAVMHELHRMMILCISRMGYLPTVLLRKDAVAKRAMQETEFAVLAVRDSIQSYLQELARFRLTRRQSYIATTLYNGIDHVARIADHIGVLGEFLYARDRMRQEVLSEDHAVRLLSLFQRALDVLEAFSDYIAPMQDSYDEALDRLNTRFSQYDAAAYTERAMISDELSNHASSPRSVLLRNRYVTDLSRIVKHIKALQADTTNEQFRIRPKKLGKHTPRKVVE